MHLTVRGGVPVWQQPPFSGLICSCGNGTVKTPNLLISCCSPPKSEGEFLEILELLQKEQTHG